ncbi:hypothetical protein K7X08_015295 [Anisodus acutangulus]|uniref:Uncharacterized protein n=1 Tax=Anisodus acutangulus TaxID=402998 RepID=A0A9Q1L465_9SOLA|nr:hypothetical protein K7X08_015295 [Anisodus acutangulus]
MANSSKDDLLQLITRISAFLTLKISNLIQNLVTCQLLGVMLEETSPEELQKQATVLSSVLEVLLEITKFCDLYLMERVLDDESEKKVLLAIEDAGVFTSGGMVKDKLLISTVHL